MRHQLKKLIFRIAGPKGYEKAYAKGKIADIKKEKLNEPELTFLNRFIKSDSTVLDLGANYGHYTIEMARLCPGGKVYAFEPVPFTFRVLERVVDHFKMEHISLHHLAVSDAAGQVEMVLPLLPFGAPNTGVAYIGNKEDGDSEKVQIQTVTLDEMPIKGNVDFIKMDIEGHEPKAMKGMEQLITDSRPVILIEFSHNCLQRAGEEPGPFAEYLQEKLQYEFHQVQGKQLKPVASKVPQDGYYFLIPAEKTDHTE